jgi:uncharacterized phage protein (TIGR01671 family)
MRIIKFKAKALDSGKWVKGSLVKTPFGTYIEWYEDSICNRKSISSATVCQFTGFTDKNGKEIYEGDVLRSDEYPYSFLNENKRDNYFAVVYYCEEGACFAIVTAKNHELDVRGFLDGTITSVSQQKLRNFEFVGNIHEPEWEQYGEWFHFGSAKY